MLRSLVGSEMCIRDSLQTGPEETFEPLKDWPVTPTHDVSVYGQLGGVL